MSSRRWDAALTLEQEQLLLSQGHWPVLKPGEKRKDDAFIPGELVWHIHLKEYNVFHPFATFRGKGGKPYLASLHNDLIHYVEDKDLQPPEGMEWGDKASLHFI